VRRAHACTPSAWSSTTRRAFVTSANLTEAAQGRNIEAGVLLDDAVFARALRTQFESLIDRGYVRRLTRPC
jgi:phosphatidylserine/phosphatidylglycerophosphate/cardiolipin synthase-like enzyme